MSDPRLLLLVPLRVEAWAVRAFASHPDVCLLRTGAGPHRAAAAARVAAGRSASAVAVVGVAGAVGAGLRSGDVVVAGEVTGPGGHRASCAAPDVLTAAVGDLGVRVGQGTVTSCPRLLGPRSRRLLHPSILAVDTESAWLVSACEGRPLAVLRVIVDGPAQRLADVRTVPRGLRALRALGTAVPALRTWTRTVAPRQPERTNTWGSLSDKAPASGPTSSSRDCGDASGSPCSSSSSRSSRATSPAPAAGRSSTPPRR